MHFGTALRLLVASAALLALAPPSAGQRLTRVPALGGRQPIESMVLAGSTPDGTILFLVVPDGFVAGDSNGQTDLIAFDRNIGVHTVLLHAQGGGSPNAGPEAPRTTSAANRIVFQTHASNLVAGDSVFLHDVLTGQARLVSRSTGGAYGTAPPFPSIRIARRAPGEQTKPSGVPD